jgi:hypothetical protein
MKISKILTFLAVIIILIAIIAYAIQQKADSLGGVPAPTATATPSVTAEPSLTAAPSKPEVLNLIKVISPKPGDQITSPLKITGEARGNWFFEASFPVVLTNWDGLIIAEGIATAKGEWMTTDFVPFEATLTYIKPVGGEAFNNRGFLILKKDNPSGLSENDAALEIPIFFK